MPLSSTDIIAIVNEYCRLNVNDTALQTFVTDAVNIAFYDVARANPWPELLVQSKTNVLTPLITNTNFALDANFMKMERVRYTSGGRTWGLPPRTGLVPPAIVDGKPRCYFLLQNVINSVPYGLRLEPYANIISGAGDFLEINYYKVPTLFDGTNGNISTMWVDEIIKQAEHYVLTYQNKLEQAKEIWSTTLTAMSKASQSQGQ